MKRGGPLKRTPLNRGNSQLKRTTGLNPRSEKTQKRYEEERIPLVKKILAERPHCQACQLYMKLDGVVWTVRQSVDCHEKLARGVSGGVHGEAWLEEDNILAVCRQCHRRITDFPSEAEQLGLLTRRWG